MNLFTLARNFDSLDHRKIAEWFAMNEPDLFVDACRVALMPTDWLVDLKAAIDNSQYVLAIKTVRQHTGLGLFEGKQVVDRLTGRPLTSTLADEANTVLNTLRAAGFSAS